MIIGTLEYSYPVLAMWLIFTDSYLESSGGKGLSFGVHNTDR